MKPNQIFECENTIGIWDLSEKQFFEGICVALSALWCRNILQGKRDVLSAPSTVLAAPLQAKYEIVHKNDYTAFLTGMGMTITEERTDKGIATMNYLMKNNGQYMLRYPGHAMAATIKDGSYYFFDPEEGLFKYNGGPDFERAIMKRYADEFGEDWTIRKVSLP